jgi:prepilin signal peptidase PulO-like enzyme (type II secretory pathway)
MEPTYDMRLLIGGFLGYVAGLSAWLATSHFVDRYRVQPAEAVAEATAGSATEATPQSPPEGAPDFAPDASPRPLHWARGAISPEAAVIQAAMVLWGAYVWWRASDVADLVPALLVTALLVTITLVDLRVRRIPNALVLALLLWGLVQVIWLGRPDPLAAVLGLLVGGGLLLLIALAGRGAMGAGDVKLAAALGAVLGYPLILHGLFYGILAGGAAALVLLVTRRVRRKDYIAYGPYLALGAWIVWTRALGLWPWV